MQKCADRYHRKGPQGLNRIEDVEGATATDIFNFFKLSGGKLVFVLSCLLY